MAQSSIEWTEMTWNPTTGCDKVSAGCKFCYAEVMTRRLNPDYAIGFVVRVERPKKTSARARFWNGNVVTTTMSTEIEQVHVFEGVSARNRIPIA